MMSHSLNRLISLRVTDVMNPRVVEVPMNATMAEAAKILSENEISGAPVVDEHGHCVGVLSTTDFALREGRREGHATAEGSVEQILVQDTPGGVLYIEEVAEDAVHQHMTTAVQTTTSITPLLEAARCMCSEHIHRLIVLDEAQRPVGVVSALDLVAAMVASVEGWLQSK